MSARDKTVEQLRQDALRVRRLIIQVANVSRTAHVGSSLSCVDILTTLYFQTMRIDPDDYDHRDIFVLSKGHAAMGLYAVLTVRGLMRKDTIFGYLQNNGTLPAHLDYFTSRWVEASAGSLGHGFNMGLGMAHGYRIKEDNRQVYSLIGDGESQEGSIWEGAMFGAKLKIENFTAILDNNNLQGYGRPSEICCYDPIAEKWRAFGWDVQCVDGHDYNALLDALAAPRSGRPRMIVARTVKGKGISFMEDELKWHYFIVTDELKQQALEELGED